MELERIWKNFNISFILVLPLFKDILENIKTKQGYSISIHSLFYEYGLLNCYLLNNNSKYTGTIRLLFEKSKILESTLVNNIDKPVNSLLDLLINSKYFYDIKNYEKYIIIYLKIDKIWEKDIYQIMKSNYSKVSQEYKNRILYKGEYELINDSTINYLYLKNIPAKITSKHKSLENDIKNLFKISSEIEVQELFPEFNENNKESINILKLKE
jgi:hypothetical protein